MNYILVFLLACLHMVTSADVTRGGCSCAVFSSTTSTEPLIEHQLPLNVSCDEDGAEKCLQLCVILAQGAKERAPALICEKLNRHVENLKISVHTKTCETGEWKFTGLEISEAICCHDGKATPCNLPIE